jgi:hypothetical protein
MNHENGQRQLLSSSSEIATTLVGILLKWRVPRDAANFFPCFHVFRFTASNPLAEASILIL